MQRKTVTETVSFGVCPSRERADYCTTTFARGCRAGQLASATPNSNILPPCLPLAHPACATQRPQDRCNRCHLRPGWAATTLLRQKYELLAFACQMLTDLQQGRRARRVACYATTARHLTPALLAAPRAPISTGGGAAGCSLARPRCMHGTRAAGSCAAARATRSA